MTFDNEQQFLSHYQQEKERYEKPSVTTDIVVFTVCQEQPALEVLLIERKHHPFQHCWALPGGFMDINESLEQAVQRELQEETGITDLYAEQLYTWSDVERDPRMRILSASYMALAAKNKMQLKAGDDARDARWFSVATESLLREYKETKEMLEETEEILLTLTNKEKAVHAQARLRVRKQAYGTKTTEVIEMIEDGANTIAFDHAKIILYSLYRLRNKVEYTNIAFNLMPEKFTLPRLQAVYEMILGKSLFKAQFRRHIADKVLATGEEIKEGAHRPSQLYRYNHRWVFGSL
ncbi:NUDIX hydrolase [Metasolibacillus meyeri]|uniref:NUDIX hydrolase n=1 Tax=Metasolibacillus meyeri TaxID=1071052 RepID=UPI000D2F6264|nr:NUDIX domain-containing protein [Metasolibacillus meyeri]